MRQGFTSRPNREIMRGALARAINASGCALVPREPTEAMLLAGKQTLKGIPSSEFESIVAECVYKSMLAAADPREQALDRMAENAQELGLYDEGKEKDDGSGQ